LNQDGSGPCLYGNCTDNEFGHLYYTELGNVYYGGLTYTGDFQNFIESWYWTGTEHTDTTGAWGFGANAGSLGGDGKIGAGTAIAVRDGNVTVVPEPISLTLFLVGGATIGVRRFIRKQVA
ncbi:MAG: PEP-CTERM sorting domain-containing protein, partial [Nitrospiraceae bacterium]